MPYGDVLREEERVLHRAERPQTGVKTVMPPKTRAKSGGIEPDVLFPSVPKVVPSSQLPTVKSVIGVMRHLTAAKVAHDKAVREASKLLYAVVSRYRVLHPSEWR